MTRSVILFLIGLVAIGGAGCNPLQTMGWVPPPVPPPPAQELEIRDAGIQQVSAVEPDSFQAKLIGARDYMRQEKYDEAAALYRHISKQKKVSKAAVQEALFGMAECYRLQGEFPKAAATYKRLLEKHPRNPYQRAATRHIYDIANYWLDDTREAMVREKEGKGWVSPIRFWNFHKSKPFMDEEGRAIELLEQVHWSDIRGQEGLGPKALFMAGGVKYFNENYEEADHFFTQIHEHHADHPLAPRAVEYAIQAKQMSTGGADYDGRKVAEARLLIESALRNYPELAQKKKEFLDRQLTTLDLQQATKDYRKGKFYERTGHPGSAYFYYMLVQRRFPGTRPAAQAAARVEAIKAKHPHLVAAAEAREARRRQKAQERREQFDNLIKKPVKRTDPLPPPPPGGVSIAPPPRPLSPGVTE